MVSLCVRCTVETPSYGSLCLERWPQISQTEHTTGLSSTRATECSVAVANNLSALEMLPFVSGWLL